MKRKKFSTSSFSLGEVGAPVARGGGGIFLVFKLSCFILFVSVLATTLLLFGCSARKSRPTQLRVHPVDWVASHPTLNFSNTLQPEYGIACKSCHGEDFSGGNSGVSCIGCHNQRRDTVTNVLTTCTGCHGGSLGDSIGAPPRSVAGAVDDTARGVGGHRVMVFGSTLFSGTDCQTCHIKPVFVLTASHITPSGTGSDGRAEVVFVVFSGTARLFSSRYGSPTFDTLTGSCASVYCHGAFPGGDTARVVNFYAGSTEAFCGSCHPAVGGNDFARLSGKHFKHDSLGIPCTTCHFVTVDSLNAIQPASRLLNHVNGIFDVAFDPTKDTLGIGLFDGVSCSGLPDSPGCHANRRDW
jgi:predicted CxxxxCH...CXXCH cytochrome family protein